MSRKSGQDGIGGRDYPNPGCDYSDEEVEFLKAVDQYRREHKKSYLTCVEILAVAKSLGYRKVENPQ